MSWEVHLAWEVWTQEGNCIFNS